MKKIVTLGMTVLMLVSCKDAKPQTKEEIYEREKIENRENLEQFFLGASKLCMDEDYQKYFGNYRERHLTSLEGTCCTFFVPTPFINPYEYYLYLLEEENSIIDNRDNPFELKKIRSKMKKRTDKIKEKTKAIDEENLIYKSGKVSHVEKYDFDKEKLIITTLSGLGFETDKMFSNSSINILNSSLSCNLPLAPEEAEKLFDYYKGNDIRLHTAKSTLNTRITYKVQKPLKNNFGSHFEAVIKKIEFFYPNGWNEKIGELTF